MRTAQSCFKKNRFYKGVLGTRFGSLESEKIIIGSLQPEKIGSLQIRTGFLTFSLKNLEKKLKWQVGTELGCCLHQGGSPPKSFKSIFIHNKFVQFGKQYS